MIFPSQKAILIKIYGFWQHDPIFFTVFDSNYKDGGQKLQ